MTAGRPISDEEAVHLRRFGAELRRRRELSGVGLAEMARLVGLHPDHVGRLELGQRRPRRSTIESMSIWLVDPATWPDWSGPSDQQAHEVVDCLLGMAGPAIGRERETRDQAIRRLAQQLAERFIETGSWDLPE